MTSEAIDSPWTRVAPAEWHRTYLGHLVEVRSGATPSKDEPSFWEGEIPWVSPKDMKVLRIADSEDHVSEAALSASALRWIAEGSVLMVTRGMILDHTVPIALAERPLTINQDMKALVPRGDLRGDFLMWMLVGLNPAILARVEEAAHGTKALRTDQWRKLPLAIPAVDVQRRIADFLDAKTARIDALIAKQEQLLALLVEKRQGLITQAVTKGLDPNAPMKDSGVESIGHVPAHWKVRRLKQLGQIRSGIAKGRDAGDKPTEARPYLRVANVQNGWLSLDDIETIEVTQEEARRYALRAGDVLMNEGGDFDKLGRGYVWEGKIADCIHQNHVFAFRPAKGIDSYWINLATQAGYLRHFFILRSKQSTNLASISATNLGEAPIVMPPPAEVDAVLARLRSELHRLDGLATRAEAMVEKLREYRQALITAAITGQLDAASSATSARASSHHAEAVGV